MSNLSRRISGTLYGVWGGIGAYRGHQFYNKEANSNTGDKNKYGGKIVEPKYYIISDIGVSLLISMFYICPPFSLVALYSELCNLEDFLRNRNIE